MKNVFKTVAGIIVLTAGSISVEAADYADLSNDELVQQRSQVREYAGKHGRFGYRKPDHVNRDGYVSNNIYGAENLAYYGDWNANSIYVFDVDNMRLLTTIHGTGDGPYGIDQQSPEKAYALTRKTESLTIVNNETLRNDGLIPLKHKPRSTNYNPATDLTLVSGGDKAMTSIIKVGKDKVVQVIGEDLLTEPRDYGGSLSTGHPLWVTDRQFFMLGGES